MAMMNTQFVQNQKYLLVGILNQSFAKIDKSLRVHCLIVDHETNLTLIGNRGDQVDSFLFGIEPYSRVLTSWGIASTMLAVAAKPCLITPIYLCVFFLSPCCNGWIIFIEPLLSFLKELETQTIGCIYEKQI
jgi:hypothetical protein